jgi:protein tyrosine/serine phosphatase
LIHCKHGKDRTGIIIAIIHFICNTKLNNIVIDYLESESVVQQTHIDIFLNTISKFQSVGHYVGYNQKEINFIKFKLKKNENFIFS